MILSGHMIGEVRKDRLEATSGAGGRPSFS
jgi:hypothetical protein